MAPLDPESPRFSHANRSAESQPISAGPCDSLAAAIEDNSRIDSRRSAVRMFWVAIIAAGGILVASTAMGQAAAPAAGKYDTVKMLAVFEGEEVLKKTSTGAANFARGNKDFNANAVRAYFTNYVPAVFTDPTQSAKMGELVKEVNTHIGRAARVPAIAGRLNDYLYQGLAPVAAGNFYPPARVAAISILGQLNSSPLNQQTRTAPVPYQRSLTVIWPLVTAADQPDGIRAAAIAALHRYIMLTANVSPQIASRVVAEMEKFVNEPKPQNRDAQVHAYLQRFAVDILTRLKPGSDATLGTQLVSISLDENAPDLIAFHSAGKLSGMTDSFKGKAPDAQKLTEAWSKRLLKTLENEYARLEAYKRPQMAMAQPQDPESFLGRKKTEEKRQPRSMMGGMEGSMMDEEMMMGGMDETMMMGGMMDEMEAGYDEEMMMGGGYGMMGMGIVPEAKPQPAEVIAARQKINYALEQLNLGMVGKRSAGKPDEPKGIYAALAEADREIVDQWVTMTGALSEALNDKALDERETFQDALLVQLEQMREAFGAVEVGEADQMENEFENELMGGDLLGGANPAAGKPADANPAVGAAPIAELEAEF